MDNGPTTEAKNYQVIKDVMLKKFSAEKSEAEIIKDAMSLSYGGVCVQEFFTSAEKAYT